MSALLRNIVTLASMKDQVIATDFLISTKAGVIYTALALTESATPALRDELENQLFEAIDRHEQISQYMIDKGYYHPYVIKDQLFVDQITADAAVELSEK